MFTWLVACGYLSITFAGFMMCLAVRLVVGCVFCLLFVDLVVCGLLFVLFCCSIVVVFVLFGLLGVIWCYIFVSG